jgi:hypothetical protein
MPITVTLSIAHRARKVVVYDQLGSDVPLIYNKAYESNDTVHLVTSNTGCCCGGRKGILDVRGEVEVAPDVWEARDTPIAVVHGGVYSWPGANVPTPAAVAIVWR